MKKEDEEVSAAGWARYYHRINQLKDRHPEFSDVRERCGLPKIIVREKAD